MSFFTNSSLHSTISAQEFLKPARSYVKQLLPFVNSQAIHGAAYISSSGLQRSIAKIIPANFATRINAEAWPLPPVFGWLQRNVKGLTPEIIVDKFNCGIGLVMIVPKGNNKWQQIDGAIEIGKYPLTEHVRGII